MGEQAPNNHLNQNDEKANSGNDTSNTLLINVNNNNHSNNKAGSQRTTFLVSTIENIPIVLASNNGTNRVNHTKIQSSKFILLLNWVLKRNVDYY